MEAEGVGPAEQLVHQQTAEVGQANLHELGQLVVLEGFFLEVAGCLGCLLARVHKDEHLVLPHSVQHLR